MIFQVLTHELDSGFYLRLVITTNFYRAKHGGLDDLDGLLISNGKRCRPLKRFRIFAGAG